MANRGSLERISHELLVWNANHRFTEVFEQEPERRPWRRFQRRSFLEPCVTASSFTGRFATRSPRIDFLIAGICCSET